MNRLGVIINPRSRHHRRNIRRTREILRQWPAVSAVEIDSIDQIHGELARFAENEIGIVAISGGDGTIQAVMTALLNGGSFERLPQLAVISAGTTNLIAASAGVRGRPDSALDRLCKWSESGGPPARTLLQPVLSLQRTPREPAIHGMFLGTAAFYRAVLLAESDVHSLGVERNLAVAMALGMSVFHLLTQRRPGGLWQGEAIALEADNAALSSRDHLLFMSTTLDRLVLGLTPFWGEGEGNLRYMAIDYPANRLLSALLPMARGKPRPWFAEAGYRSGRARECRLTLQCPIVFDGEIVTPEPGTPVVLRSDHRLEFWRDG